MFRKSVLKMMMVGIVLALPLFIGVVSPHAGVAGEPGDVQLKGGKIVGVLTGTYNPTTGIFATNVVGSLYLISGTTQVALEPVNFLVNTPPAQPSEAEFLAMTEADLENCQLEGAGPAGVFSPAGGETLMITRVKEVFVAKSANGTIIMGAIVTIRALAN